jgi:hypothetical protein
VLEPTIYEEVILLSVEEWQRLRNSTRKPAPSKEQG